MRPQPVRDRRDPMARSDWKVMPMLFMVLFAARRIAAEETGV